MQRVRAWISRLGLWPRMAATISLGFSILFLAALALGERALNESADRLLDERLVVAQIVASELDGIVREGIFHLENARQFADFDPQEADLSGETHTLAHFLVEAGNFSPGAAFLDASGRVIVSYPQALYPPEEDLSSLSHITRALSEGQPVVSEPFLDPLERRPVVAVAVPVYDGGRLLGLLQGLIDLRGQGVLSPLEQAASVGSSVQVSLVDVEGRALASQPERPFLSSIGGGSSFREAISRKRPFVENLEETDERLQLVAFAPLETAPFGVALESSAQETYAVVSRLRNELIVVGVVALAGVWLFTLLGTRLLIRPVQRLTLSAQHIAGGDLETPLLAPEGGEIGAMAEALEQMREQLLKQIQELEAWNERLEGRVRERTEALRQEQALTQKLLRRAIRAQEEERARLSRELHDEIGQSLTALKLGLDRLDKVLPADSEQPRQRLEQVRPLTDQAIGELRNIIANLRPGVLDQLGLLPALEWMAEKALKPQGLSVQVRAEELSGSQRLPGEIETLLFRIAQEAMSNVVRHSGAEHLDIVIERERDQVKMRLVDDGRGFDVSAVMADTEPDRGLGLAGMQERASLAGGRVFVESEPGTGTTVEVVIPLPNLENDEN